MDATTTTEHSPAGATSPLVGVDPAVLAQSFGRTTFPVGHALAGHPRLTVEAIADLADALPRASAERRRAKGLNVLTPGEVPDVEGPPSQTAREIDHNGCWMVLWNIEQVPEYAALLDACLDEVERHLGDRDGGMLRREAFLFLSAPDTVTPWHVDPEHNLLLQIRGSKEMTIGRYDHPGDHQRELERVHDTEERNLSTMPTEEQTYRLTPGRGVYVYPFAPHWVRNGGEVSVSLSITFRTRATQRAEGVHRANARLRRLGLSPRPAGSSKSADAAKSAVVAALHRVRTLAGVPTSSHR